MQKIVKYINDVRSDFKQAIFYLNLDKESTMNYDNYLDFAIYICLNILELNLIERILTNKDPFPLNMEEDILAEDHWGEEIVKDPEVALILGQIEELQWT